MFWHVIFGISGCKPVTFTFDNLKDAEAFFEAAKKTMSLYEWVRLENMAGEATVYKLYND